MIDPAGHQSRPGGSVTHFTRYAAGHNWRGGRVVEGARLLSE
jgi:hypothetical protein